MLSQALAVLEQEKLALAGQMSQAQNRLAEKQAELVDFEAQNEQERSRAEAQLLRIREMLLQ